ncbi:MAG: hypothetical protein PHX08_17455 [Lachnospiraceae bacterium]|nr:hypothetical protein [Lachnospiraceae bacterium]
MKIEEKLNEMSTEMAEHICDNICKHPGNVSEDELENICCECKLGQYICNILNAPFSDQEKGRVTWEKPNGEWGLKILIGGRLGRLLCC